MMGFAIAAVIVIWSAVFIWLLHLSVEGSRTAVVATAVFLMFSMGVGINIVAKPSPGPCHQWETRMMYNAATKTMMPSRVCVLRGEWVEEGHDNQ